MEKTQITGKWKKPKKDQILIGILVGVLLLVIAMPQGGGEEETGSALPAQEGESGEEDPVKQMEQEFAAVLEQVEGVGKVRVMLTVKSTGERTVEKDRSVQEENTGTDQDANTVSRSEETTVYARDSEGNETPFVTKKTAPEIEGVLVAAQGGDNLTVAENITEAAEVLFGVEVHKIKVMKLN